MRTRSLSLAIAPIALLGIVAACSKEDLHPPVSNREAIQPRISNKEVDQRAASNKGKAMIDRESLVSMFARMHDNHINTDQKLLWGYFFTDKDEAKLKAVVPELERAGYRFVEVFQAETDKGASPFYFLHVEKVETHTVDSLFARNDELYAFAHRHGLDSYDGMDVGRVDGKPFR